MIIAKIAANRMVERIISRQTGHCGNPYIDDLAQDIYVVLLGEDDALIERLYDEGTLEFYIIRIAKNNLYSVTSPFYYKYQRFRRMSNELPDTI